MAGKNAVEVDATLVKDTLYALILRKRDDFANEAAKHKTMNRRLWSASTIFSVGVAGATPLHDTYDWIPPVTMLMAIVLPAVNAYLAFRSPDQLWILETSVRNRLSDLLVEMELDHARGKTIDRERIQQDLLRILAAANEEWLASKRGK